jgi:hypothetical protein
MSKMNELAYDIEQLYIEGLHPTKIAKELNCPLTVVYDWLESTGVDAEGPAVSEGDAVFASMVKELQAG